MITVLIKPRIKLKERWYDCGHVYEQWICRFHFGGTECVGFGPTPLDAYRRCMGLKR